MLTAHRLPSTWRRKPGHRNAGRWDNCRARVGELNKAVADLRTAETSRANTVEPERLDREIGTASKARLEVPPSCRRWDVT